MKSVIVIPSRLGSSRFPNKPLAKICGREMILRVCDQCSKTGYEVFVATPDDAILDLVSSNGYGAIMTTNCATGTDRVAQASELISADIFVNVQGDEPLVLPADILKDVICKETYYNTIVGSMCRLTRNADTIVKVVHNAGQLVYLTRVGTSKFAQCGLYAFTRKELEIFSSVEESEKQASLKRNESIELMRFVELGLPVRMVEISGSPAVDVPDDIKIITEVIQYGRGSESNWRG